MGPFFGVFVFSRVPADEWVRGLVTLGKEETTSASSLGCGGSSSPLSLSVSQPSRSFAAPGEDEGIDCRLGSSSSLLSSTSSFRSRSVSCNSMLSIVFRSLWPSWMEGIPIDVPRPRSVWDAPP